MIGLALFLKRNGYRPDQVQDFIPAPFDIATCMYYTGVDPFTGEEVYTAKNLSGPQAPARPLAVLQARELLRGPRGPPQAPADQDLIGTGCDALIPANPPKAALQARMKKATRDVTEGRFVHQIDGKPPAPAAKAAAGYRPDRKSARKRPR